MAGGCSREKLFLVGTKVSHRLVELVITTRTQNRRNRIRAIIALVKNINSILFFRVTESNIDFPNAYLIAT